MKISISYSPVNNQLKIEKFEMEGMEELQALLNKLLYPLKTTVVYLVCIDYQVIVTENVALIEELFLKHLNALYPFYEIGKSDDGGNYIFECDSYEAAYKMALDMMEFSPLCYEPDLSKLN